MGIIEANRPAFMKTIRETLFFTSDRVIVARTSGSKAGAFGVIGMIYEMKTGVEKAKKVLDLPLEDILKAHKDNYSIPNSAITKIELKKTLNIITSGDKARKEQKWYAGGFSRGLVFPEKKKREKVRYPEDFEDILRPIFGDKLVSEYSGSYHYLGE